MRTILLLLIIPLYAYSITYCELPFGPGSDHLHYFDTKYAEKVDERMAELFKVEISELKNFDVFEPEREGWLNKGIYHAVFRKQDTFIKVIGVEESYDQYKFRVLLQQHFGELGLSPKVYGLLSEKQLTAMGDKLLKKTQSNHNFAILMEKLPEGTLIKEGDFEDGTPPLLEFLTREKAHSAIEQIEAIENVINDLRLRMGDLQLHITREGKVYLIDFDSYSYIMPNKRGFFKPSSFRNIKNYLSTF